MLIIRGGIDFPDFPVDLISRLGTSALTIMTK